MEESEKNASRLSECAQFLALTPPDSIVTLHIWVRHAPKLYANSKGPPGMPLFDPPVTHEVAPYTLQYSKSICTLLSIFRCSVPNFTSSPYRRAHQTAVMLSNRICQSFKVATQPVVYSTDLGEFLGHQKYIGYDSTSKRWCTGTLKRVQDRLPRVGESKSELRERCKRALISALSSSGANVYVTHGIILQIIGDLLSEGSKSGTDFEKGFVMINRQVYPLSLDLSIMGTQPVSNPLPSTTNL